MAMTGSPTEVEAATYKDGTRDFKLAHMFAFIIRDGFGCARVLAAMDET
jgi:hypothetical protein